MKRTLVLALLLLLCVCAVSAPAVNSPTLESFTGSGIRKKEPPGKLQKTILAAMREAGSVRLLDVINENDITVDESGNETAFPDADIEVIFTPEIYRVNQDGSADLRMQLADVNAFKSANGEKEVSVVVGIPQMNSATGDVKYIEIPAEVKDGKVMARFPAPVIDEMRRVIMYGWNCVCMIVSRDAPTAPAEQLFFVLPAEDGGVSV